MHVLLHSVPLLCSKPPPTHMSAGDWTLTGKSGSESFGGTAPFSWVLVHKTPCALQYSISQSCVSSGSSMVRLIATSSKRAYAMPKYAAPRAPAPMRVHCWPTPPQEVLKHSSVSVSVRSLSPGVHKVSLRPLSVFGGNGVLLGFLWPWMWLSFRWDGSHWGLEQESDLFWFLSFFLLFFFFLRIICLITVLWSYSTILQGKVEAEKTPGRLS